MSVYTPKNILVTGGCGFIGSHVARHLVTEHPEYTIVILDLLDYSGTLNNVQDLLTLPNVSFVRGDICSADLVRHLLLYHEIDTIMHFAAQTHVDNSFGNSLGFTRTNVYGTHVLLQVANSSGRIRRFLHVSTDEVYGENRTVDTSHHEEMVLEPSNPYAATKAGAEFIAKSYLRSFNFPVIITRGNNVYGPNQYPEKLIPKTICRVLNGLPACVHGDGQHARSFMHVKDVAAAFDTVLHRGVLGETYNIGVTKDRSNLSVVQDLLRLLVPETATDPAVMKNCVSHVADRKYNDQRYQIDARKLSALGWVPRISWKDGLRQTIDWYVSHLDHWESEQMLQALKPHPVTQGPADL